MQSDWLWILNQSKVHTLMCEDMKPFCSCECEHTDHRAQHWDTLCAHRIMNISTVSIHSQRVSVFNLLDLVRLPILTCTVQIDRRVETSRPMNEQHQHHQWKWWFCYMDQYFEKEFTQNLFRPKQRTLCLNPVTFFYKQTILCQSLKHLYF